MAMLKKGRKMEKRRVLCRYDWVTGEMTTGIVSGLLLRCQYTMLIIVVGEVYANLDCRNLRKSNRTMMKPVL